MTNREAAEETLKEIVLFEKGLFPTVLRNAKGSCDIIESRLIQAERRGAEKAVNGNTSDGYHTFNELYDHRCLLWINLCLLQHQKMTYLVEDHFDGWFLLGCQTKFGQLSYHCPNKYLHLCKKITRRHPEFDGHKSKDVIERLEQLALRSLSVDEVIKGEQNE